MQRAKFNQRWGRKTSIRLLAICLISLTMMAFAEGCIRPASVKPVMHPRDGAPLDGRLDIVYSDAYQIRLGGLEKLHSFDIRKYDRIYQRLVNEGLLSPDETHVPPPIDDADLLRIHTPAYLNDLRNPAVVAKYLESGPVAVIPAKMSESVLLKPFRVATGGTLIAARLALKHGMAVNLGGGYHHAEPDRGGGFCIFADMPVAIRALQSEGLIRRALVVDLDVHQGNGTAACIAADDDVYTFDMHQGNIYPHPKRQNDRDIALPAGTSDEEFLSILHEELPLAFDAARPDIVFYQAGVDGLASDPLADFAMTIDGMIERDAIVFAEAHHRNIPIVMVLGGGYSAEAWRTQFLSLRQLIETYTGRTPRPSAKK